MKKSAELLAPAGSLESLKAAVNAGADAVYIGGAKFGARAYAVNAEEDSLLEGIRYAHLFGARVHLTVNTLLKDRELEDLCSYIKPYYEAGLDAAIVQDLGVFDFLHRHFPLLSLHASTQMTITGPEGARMLKSLGAERVIPARELSLKELTEIKSVGGIEVETFVHGALCYCYSGQCFMSSLIGGRSGNRGRCAQPCRLKYELTDQGKRLNRKEEVCLLSCRDLCALDVLPDLLDAGIDSLKIEGRMKSARYTAGVVMIWRKYLDLYEKCGRSGYRVDPADRKLLLDLYDRGGQTDGYFYRHNGPEMMAMKEKPEFREGNEALFKYLDETYVNEKRVLPVSGIAEIKAGAPMRLQVSFTGRAGDFSVSAEGPVPEPAQKAAASEEEVRKRLLKTGDTVFHFETLKLTLDPGLFLPVRALNELRRAALDELTEQILRKSRRDAEAVQAEKRAEEARPEEAAPEEAADLRNTAPDAGIVPTLHVSAETEQQLNAAIESNAVSELSFSADAVPPEKWQETVNRIRESRTRIGDRKKAFLLMPQIFRAEAADFFDRNREALKKADFDGFVIRSLEENGYLKRLYETEFHAALPPLYFDFQIYGMNREAEDVLYRLGAKRLTLPIELNFRELTELPAEGRELVISGRLPMMVTAQCLKKNTQGCDHVPQVLSLKDRTGKEMPVKNCCSFCYNTILNAEPLSLIGLSGEIRSLRCASYRILFTTELKDEATKILAACADAFLDGKKVPEPYETFTRGHMKRGVE